LRRLRFLTISKRLCKRSTLLIAIRLGNCRSAVRPLIPYLRAEGIRTFAEPCAGANDLVRHLEAFGFACGYSGDIQSGQDALARADYGDVDATITNPPHSVELMHPLIDHFLTMRAPCWLLMKWDWAANVHAAPFLPRCTHAVAIGRIKWMPDSPHSGKDNFGWLRFDDKHRSGPILRNDRGVGA
jgi:hypothetical protein